MIARPNTRDLYAKKPPHDAVAGWLAGWLACLLACRVFIIMTNGKSIAMTKKACVIFVPTMQEQAEDLHSKLSARAFDVCLTEAPAEDVAAAKLGSTSANHEIEACLNGAELKIFLIPAADTPSSIVSAGIRASGTPGRVVAICEDIATAPKVFDDVAHTVISCASPDLIEAILVKEDHEDADGKPKLPRKPARVKCQ